MSKWAGVTKRRPCPICGDHHWCGVSADGAIVHCMREPSDWPCATGGGGWFHRLEEAPSKPNRPRRRAPEPEPASTLDCEALLAGWRIPSCKRIRGQAEALGVSETSLRRLGACFSPLHEALAFPMYDETEQIVGIRLRHADGRKRAVKGSKAGIFLADACMGDLAETVLICEGPTDTAALLDLDFVAIGRPSCLGQEPIVRTLVCGRHVVILADRDEPKTRKDGSPWFPGAEGAEQLAKALLGHVKSLKIVKPPKVKDARAWLCAGATHAIVQAVIDNTRQWRPKEN